MTDTKTRTLCISALFMALTFTITRFIQIPIPLGYFNVGNSVIMLGCLFVPKSYGILIGGVGSSLADLTSFPVYTIPTLIIKSFMPYTFYSLQELPIKKEHFRNTISFSIATLIPLLGYTVTGCIIYGSIATGIAQLPGLLIEYVANIIIFSALSNIKVS